ncbi:helix-turn-helix domain-containing protein [Actinomadura rupiterrae]|uniref:helix-turn-helix domain-containing protein n=1 Tax=Actinomadura rupiterrae TaxID=559627 RepID=UPI0020A336B9|nr:helix-turn-helix transcriptional regulator [Actinomadura rupiterrae]MCP2340673.1 ribosome-binding protein aMBF1 (putative translation factor) [Actinomadura rupiterrae]
MTGVAGDDSRARRPRDYVIDGDWPQAGLADHHGAHVAQQLAVRLARAMAAQGWSAKRLGAVSGVNRQTIANVLAGAVWADLLTIANLERALGPLWPENGEPGRPAAAAPEIDGGP